MERSAGSIRIGPVSIFSLMIILCLAVMAVLSIATAHASLALTERQARSTWDLYANENAAQTFVAELDRVIEPVRASGGSAYDSELLLEYQISTITALAKTAGNHSNDEEAQADSNLEVNASMDGPIVTANFLCNGYQNLSISLELLDGGRYQITQWIASTVWPEDEQDTTHLFGG